MKLWVGCAALLLVACSEVWGHNHHPHATLTSPKRPTTSPQVPKAPAQVSKSQGSPTAKPGTTTADEDQKRNKRQWFHGHFGPNFPGSFQGPHFPNQPFPMPHQGYNWQAWQGWNPRYGQMSFEELMQYQRFRDEQWQHMQWMWDQWRRQQGLPVTQHHPMMPGYPPFNY